MYLRVLLLHLLLFDVQCNENDHLETEYEDTFYCKISDGSTMESEERILVLSPADYYFYKSAKFSSITGKHLVDNDEKTFSNVVIVSGVINDLSEGNKNYYLVRNAG